MHLSTLTGWIRGAVLVLAMLLLGVAGGLYGLARNFDATPYRAAAVAWLQQHLRRDLDVAGPMQLSVFPRLELRLSGLSLSEVGRPYSVLTVDEAALAPQLLPLLLRGELVIDGITAQGVRATLLRDAAGQGNFDDLLALPDTRLPLPPGLKLAVQRIGLTNVQARIRDEAAGIDGVLDLKELSTGPIAEGVESQAEVVAQFGFKSPALKGELSGATRFTPERRTGVLRFSGMNLAYKGDAPSASSIDASLRGNLAWNTRSGALDAQALILRLTANTAGLKLSGSTLTTARFVLDTERKAYTFNRLKLRALGTQGGRPIDLQLDWPELDVQGTMLKGSALTGHFSIGGALPLQANFQGGSPVGDFEQLRVPGFLAHATGRAAGRKLDATLRSELVLQPARQRMQFEKSTLEIDHETPGLRPLRIALAGSGRVEPAGARWDVSGSVNGNGLQSGGELAFATMAPQLDLRASFDTLDLASLLPPGERGDSADADAPVDLSALRAVDGRFSLRVNRLRAQHTVIDDARLEGSLDAGMLRVPSLRGEVWGGKVRGSVFADARASRIAVRAVANGVDVGALLRDVAGRAPLSGVGVLAFDLDTAGRTSGELQSRLKGSAELHLRDGSIVGIDLADSLRHASAVDPARRSDATHKANGAERTEFSEMQASFRIADGVVRSSDLQLRHPLLRVGGEGVLDLPRGRFDGSARALVVDAATPTESGSLAALRGLSVPLAVGGPYDALVWKVQWSNTSPAQTRAQADARSRERAAVRGAGPQAGRNR